jgi:hypothetical protein
VLGEGEPQAGLAGLGRHKRIEDLGKDLSGNTWTLVGHGDGAAVVPVCAHDAHAASRGRCLERIGGHMGDGEENFLP